MVDFRDTIFSLSSGAGLAGVSVIRISGRDAERSISLMCRSGVKAGELRLRGLYHPETSELLDKAMVSWQPAPKSFTGENIVEFQTHGGIATVRSVLDALGAVDKFRQAEAGEFSKRAFMNGRLDLVEIEGLADLIRAETDAQRRQALGQVTGKASEKFNQWREALVQILAYLEASIDFVDEDDISEDILEDMRDKLIHLRNDMMRELQQGDSGAKIRDGVRVVLAGQPNVGKSSILNYLAKQDIAIVSDIAGTTRDWLEVTLELNGIPVIVTDTAGLRHVSEDEIEKVGMTRTRQKSREADLVVWVGEAGQKKDDLQPDTDAEVVCVWNKCDLAKSLYEGEVSFSVKTGEGLKKFDRILLDFVKRNFSSRESALLTRDRQFFAVTECVAAIDKAMKIAGLDLELIAENLRIAADQLGKLVGRIDVEDLLDVIFQDFCVGK